MKTIGYNISKANPCLLIKRKEQKITYMAVYIDDCLFLGDKDMIEETIKELKELGFTLKIQHGLNNYLGCKIKYMNNNKAIWIRQPHTMKKIIDT